MIVRRWYQNSSLLYGPYKGLSPPAGRLRRRSSRGLAVAVQTRPHDAQDGDDEQDGEVSHARR